MNKKLAVVYRVIVAIVLVISIFPSLIVLAVGSSTAKGADGKDYTYSTEDDGTDGPDVSTLRFELTVEKLQVILQVILNMVGVN